MFEQEIKEETELFNLDLPKSLKKKLRIMAKRLDRSMGSLIRNLISDEWDRLLAENPELISLCK